MRIDLGKNITQPYKYLNPIVKSYITPIVKSYITPIQIVRIKGYDFPPI